MQKTEDLYTTKDVERIRKLLVGEQGGIDPILQVPFKEPPCLDHDHETQLVRGALGRNSNAFEGKVYNAFVRCLRWQTDLSLIEVLKNLVIYLENGCSVSAYHPAWIKRVTTDFRGLSADKQSLVLSELGDDHLCRNKKEREDAFRKYILSRKHGFDKLARLINEKKLS